MKKFKGNFIKGFTILELTVVIAIIGVLSAIVVASLANAKNKSADLSIKTNLENLKPQSEIYFSINKNFTDFCNDNTVKNLISSASKASGSAWSSFYNNDGNVTCNNNGSAWATVVKLKNSNVYYCIDNTGKTAEISSMISYGVTSCS